MVLDFIDVAGGFFEIGDMKARTTLAHKKDGQKAVLSPYSVRAQTD